MTQKFTGQLTRKELDSIAPIGNSPTYMTQEDMKKVRGGGLWEGGGWGWG
jgi:hypothetical protein